MGFDWKTLRILKSLVGGGKAWGGQEPAAGARLLGGPGTAHGGELGSSQAGGCLSR